MLFGVLVGTASFALLNSPLHADEEKEEHDHDHHHNVAGPNGGRVLHEVSPHLEFLVTKDRKVRISALSDDMKKIVPISDDLKIVFTGGERTSPTHLNFSKESDALLSSGVLPDGKNFPVVLVIRKGSEAPVYERFQLNLNPCPTCEYLEYACTCDHSHDDEAKE